MSHLQTYNMRVFDERLKSIFNQQASIQTLINRLKGFCIHDDEHGINLNGHTYLKGLKREIADCLAHFYVPYTGDISEGQYYSFSSAVNKKLSSLQRLKSILEQYINECSKLERDYSKSRQAYQSLKQVMEYTQKTITTAKQEIRSYLYSCCETISESDYNKHLNKLDAIKLDFSLPKFAVDFHQSQGRLTQDINALKSSNLSELERLQAGLFKLRADYSTMMNIKEMQVSRQKDRKDSPLNVIKAEIEGLIEEMPHQVDISDIVRKFNSLKESSDSALIHEFRHLKTELSLRKVSVERRNDLYDRLQKLLQLPESEQVSETILSLQKAVGMPVIKESHYARLCLMCDTTIAKEERRQEAKIIRERQILYEKNQIVSALKYLNYEVVSDTTVIDFLDDTYLFQVPNQDNFISLEYKKDKFLINFLIPEQIGELSQTEKDRKVSEMSKVCDDYRKLLKILSQHGIKNDYEQMEASLDRLVTIPKKKRDTVKYLLRKDNTAHNKEHKILREDDD